MLEQYDHAYLTPREVAIELGSTEAVIRYMLRTGAMPGKKIGVRWYVAKDWLMQPSNQDRRKEYA